MMFNEKTFAKLKAALVHLLISISILIISACFVFFIWYPGDYAKLSGVEKVFFYLILVDCLLGPLLTLLVFNPSKVKSVWLKDLSVISLLQISALVYGMFVVFDARPILLVFEGDRFRVVSSLNVNKNIPKPGFLSSNGFFSRPIIIAAHLSKPGDEDYLESVKLSMQGIYPSFRPERWITYRSAIDDVLNSSKKLSVLGTSNILNNFLEKNNVEGDDYRYLPITVDNLQAENWIAIIDVKNGDLIKFLPINGWKD